MLIHKTILDITRNKIPQHLPSDTNPISCSFQGNKLVVWYTFNDEIPTTHVLFTFHVIQTGEKFDHSILSRTSFVGTATFGDEDTPFVVHVFSERH